MDKPGMVLPTVDRVRHNKFNATGGSSLNLED